MNGAARVPQRDLASPERPRAASELVPEHGDGTLAACSVDFPDEQQKSRPNCSSSLEH
jgi:hypothetical protein